MSLVHQSQHSMQFWKNQAFSFLLLTLISSGVSTATAGLPIAVAAGADNQAASQNVADSDVQPDTSPSTVSAVDESPMTSGEALIRKLIASGWTMFFLLLVSVVGVAVTIERILRLRRNAIAPLKLADEANQLWQSNRIDELNRLAKDSPSTLGRIISALVRHRKSSHGDLSTIAGDIASRDLRRHLQRAYPLLVVATISPLLGLLGTIIGMVGAFSTIEALGELANPAAFGGDISKALITTGAGLAVAIPALSAYHFFKSRTLSLGVELEEIGSELIVEWFIAESPPAAKGPALPSGSAKNAASATRVAQPSREKQRSKPEPPHAS